MSDQALRSFAVRSALRLALGALVLRLLVPVGTMPAALADGWFLKLCPDGLPVETLARLLGESHHHHHHPGAGEAKSSPVRCDLGAALSGDVIKPDLDVAVFPPSVFADRFMPAAVSWRDSPSLPPFRSRAPPAAV
jgi:hypothetical protein